MPDLRDLASSDDVTAALAAPRAVVFKYGTRCPISAAARGQLGEFVTECPDALVYQVAVDEHRDISDDIAMRLGVAHASPQAFVLNAGEIRWAATHHAISARLLAERWRSGEPRD